MILGNIIDLIFPPRCLNCGTHTRHGAAICSACESGIRLHSTLFCGKCGTRLADNRKTCHKDFPYLLGAAADYTDDAVRNLIHGLKFRFVRAAAEPLGRLLVRYAERLALPFEGFTVIPIPLSAARLRERDFNQSELIAGIFADHFKLPLDTTSLLRVKNTKPQSETKDIAEREENVKGCFAVKGSGSLRGAHIVLIDDVTTSGTTLLEATGALKAAGAKKIIALTAARA